MQNQVQKKLLDLYSSLIINESQIIFFNENLKKIFNLEKLPELAKKI